MAKSITPRQQLFVVHRMAGMSGTEAALAAGYSNSTAAKRAHELQHQNAFVMQALETARKDLRDRANFNADTAMAEYDAAIAGARAANQHMAVMKGIEMKCRLNGLIRDKVDVSVSAELDIKTTLAEARRRLDSWWGTEVSDAEPKHAALADLMTAPHDIFN